MSRMKSEVQGKASQYSFFITRKERGLGDGGGEHQLAGAGSRRLGADRGALRGELHGTEERTNGDVLGQAALEQPLGAPYLPPRPA